MTINTLISGLFVLCFLANCSSNDAINEAWVQGTLTVADSVDNSGDYSGIGITIIKKDSATVDADTLFNATTNKAGNFSGTAEFPQRRQYQMIISRNGQNLGTGSVILADGDTVKIKGELPGLVQTLQINSREHNALATYQRVERGFQRVRTFARVGRLQGDSLVTELKKWPNLYWQVYENNPQTLAGNLSAAKSIELLNDFDKPLMMQRVREVRDNQNLAYLSATFGKDYVAETKGLDYTLAYLDSLENNISNPQTNMRIHMERITLLYDSARVEQARTSLQSYRDEYEDNESAQKWAESIEYDLNYLSPGDAIPEFSFDDNGKEVSREKLKGRPYLLEITALSSPLYQQQYDRTLVIHSIYKTQNFEVVTIPLDTSRVMVDAFFEERMRPWPVAPAKTFSPQEIIEKFNIKTLPTRFLVDRQGRIARRYIGPEYQDVIQGIQQLMKSN